MKPHLYVDFIRIDSDNILSIEGHAYHTSLDTYFRVGNKTYSFDVRKNGTFFVSFSLSKDVMHNIKAYVGDTQLPLVPGRFSRLTSFVSSYTTLGDYTLSLSLSKKTLHIARSDARQLWWRELLYLIQILVNWKIIYAIKRIVEAKTSKGKLIRLLKSPFVILESVITIPRDLFLRAHYLSAKKRKQRPIWIISDRGMSAGDSGEALFRYIAMQKNFNTDVYFAISKKSKDYNRLAKVGNVIDYGSFLYKAKFLLADKIISSQADEEVINPFLRQSERFSNLFKFDFVFLQHGIIRNDLSSWLNKYNRNIDIFVTSAQKEYDSIFTYPYEYNKDNVILSGLPRYDYLESSPQQKLIIAPTYRASLLHKGTNRYGVRKYDSTFKESDYFNFYNNLINDESLIDSLKKHGMTGEFYVHPNFASQLVDFHGNDAIKIMSYPYNYKKAINEGSLIVSDYSSLMFDFAYLKKPVIYTQFDKKEFFATHTYTQGDFFDDETDGFGEVYYTYNDTIAGITTAIEDGCRMSHKYQQRVESFFRYRDKNNAKRVFEVINKPKK